MGDKVRYLIENWEKATVEQIAKHLEVAESLVNFWKNRLKEV